MKKIKIFEGRTASVVEEKVNAWLEISKINVISIHLSTIGHGTSVVMYTIIIYYEDLLHGKNFK